MSRLGRVTNADAWDLYRHVVKTCAWTAAWFAAFGLVGLLIADKGADVAPGLVAAYTFLAGSVGATVSFATRAQDISDLRGRVDGGA